VWLDVLTGVLRAGDGLGKHLIGAVEHGLAKTAHVVRAALLRRLRAGGHGPSPGRRAPARLVSRLDCHRHTFGSGAPEL
jgi:hypothetical protein